MGTDILLCRRCKHIVTFTITLPIPSCRLKLYPALSTTMQGTHFAYQLNSPACLGEITWAMLLRLRTMSIDHDCSHPPLPLFQTFFFYCQLFLNSFKMTHPHLILGGYWLKLVGWDERCRVILECGKGTTLLRLFC